jgi:lipid A ethanolaminephosphotransferase
MIQNIVKTDSGEVLDLLSFKLFLYFILLGLMPSIIIYKANIKHGSIKSELKSKLKILGIMLLVIISIFFIFNKFYISFVREHKSLRYYINPLYSIYSGVEYIVNNYKGTERIVKSIGTDAKVPPTDIDRELIIFVVGEAARADRFSLNGYKRETNPLLKKENVITFMNAYSSGTTTAFSVPCMFSKFSRTEYDAGKAQSTENVLDVLKHARVHVLWRDNNSDSKGIAVRVPFESYKNADKNPICDVECRDEGMLIGLNEYIDNHKSGDIFIVLHQMGNHGPAYYKRYPKSFEKFKPVCKTNQLEKCSKEEINNAYDNAILYTDYFLSKAIELLKSYSDKFETALFYIGDHGESLGENGLYLHGLPYFIAPDTQKHVPAIMWFGDNFDIDKNSIQLKSEKMISHDNVFHTILGLMEIDSTAYVKRMDILNPENIHSSMKK